jgi:phosphohistidine swiveling domain-containing protein
MNVEEIVNRVQHCLARDGAERVDASPMRVAIVLSQIGDLARYVTHDPRLFPAASPPRPHGTRSDEVSTYGHAIIQIIAVALERQVNGAELVEGLENALRAVEMRDWADVRISQQSPRTAVAGIAEGLVWHYGSSSPVQGAPIVVVASHLQAAADLPANVVAIVTEQGTSASHASHMARDRGIPCVVGYIDALTKLVAGMHVRVNATETGRPLIEQTPDPSRGA